MGWEVDRENLAKERTKGDVTCIASYRYIHRRRIKTEQRAKIFATVPPG